ncbi:NAD-binding protein [Conexibacter stalactiti]|uniref:NAD-binding protein n=1 Tax=Conexibacter stalactiti TaxID=1940611 RepID=A0ABU4HHM4_9ACTN|nr:NAD-binding protein [Conexibacter stalactiti]MDW5592809.1 NAD-binding protein [Conexibacter stalactiti]MEC5033450.1 NAD-binding protein [Conexibacter stalactiti]
MSGAYLLIGEGTLAEGVEEALREAGEVVRWLRRPVDRELRRALEEPTHAAVVINRDDIAALRTALLVEYLRPEIRLVVTIFDRTVAEQLIRVIPNCNVVSMADASAGAIVGPCLDPRLVALHRDDDGGELIAVRGGDDEQPQVAPYPYQPPSAARRAANRLRAQFRPPDRSSALLLWSLFGLVALVLLEAVLAIATHHEPAVTALYEATKAIAAVGPSAFFEHGSTWQQLYGIASMALGVVLTAVFTAALVNRVLSRRLTGTFGSRTIPRTDHVVVVGLGQVGFRVCLELRALGIAVVAVEQDPQAPNVALARGLKVPVVIGRGGDRYVLERLSLGRAVALAAVTSDELANISISVSALAVEPGLRTVLRAGSNEVTRETAALFPIGVAQDLDRVAAAAVAATAIGHELAHAFVHRGETYIETPGGIERFPPAAA